MRRLPLLLVLAAVGLGLLAVPGCSRSRPSVLLVTVAGLRADAVDPGRTPNLAALAGRVRPDVLVPVPDTAVALEALMTGQGLEGLGNRFGDLFHLPPSSATLAERLAARGRTAVAFVGDGALGPLSGFPRGFEAYNVPTGYGDTPILTDEAARMKPRGAVLLPANRVRDAVGGWLADHGKEGPFFLWVHLGDLSAAARGEDPRKAWDEALARVDAAVGDLVGALRTYGVADRTVVAVVSLHGEALGARGETGHGIFLSDEVIRVPAWVAAPGGDPVSVPGEPADLGGVGRAVARAAGLAVGEPGQAGPPRSATWWPSRLYGWPDDAPPGNASAVLAKMAAAHRAMLEGKADESRRALREAAALAPRALVPRTLLARSLGAELREAKGTPREASLRRELGEVLGECRDLAGDDLPRRFDLARLLVGLGRKDEALELASAMERQAGSAGERLALARVYMEAGAAERAAEIVGELAGSEPDGGPELRILEGDLLRRAGNTYRARQAYEAALASARGRTPETLAKLGDCLQSLGEANAALQNYAEAVRLDPTYRYPHARAAEILLEEGKAGEAATALAMSVPDNGDPVALAVERARRMLAHGLTGAAAEELSRALERKPDNAKLLCWLARTYTEAGKTDEARELLDRVIGAHPDNPLAWMERARIAALGGDEDEALRCLRRAEVYASPWVVSEVRRDPVFRGKRPGSPLSRYVEHFGEKRRARRMIRGPGARQ